MTSKLTIVLSSLLALSSLTANGAQAEPSLPRTDELNGEFRNIYAATRTRILEENSPVIVCYGDHIQLNDGKHKESAGIIPQPYTALKSVDHVPLAIYSLLLGSTRISDSQIKELKKLISLVEAARPELMTYLNAEGTFSKETIERQNLILDKSLNFARLTASQPPDSAFQPAQLDAFVASLKAPLLANAYEAISAQLSSIDKTVSNWKKNMGPEKWQKLKVVINSGHMPRPKLAIFQYFCKVLNQKQEGLRVIVAEGSQDEETALTLLATHDLDRHVAQSFFQDKWRMHRDLLSDGAEKYLRLHRPQALD